ncbi:MAG: DUF2971 domain-containing protein [Lachnoclostridium sp.]|nr:DUF2971 domain-containing protein [Lachnoclostridium sp.]
MFDYESEGKEICHYTKVVTLKHLIEYRNDKQSNLRLSNVAYMNDPSEGRILIDILDGLSTKKIYSNLFGLKKKSNNERDELTLSNVYIGSFSTAINKLPMWTLYGDDSKGCCLVFEDDYFGKSSYNEDSTKTSDTILTLYKVHYVDINAPETSELFNDLKKLAETIEAQADLIQTDSKIKKWIMNNMESVRFLFKCKDYEYEDEVRVVLHPKPYEIIVDDTSTLVPKIFAVINKKLIYKEVILGSKIEKPSEIAPFLLHSGSVEKVSKSGIEYQ